MTGPGDDAATVAPPGPALRSTRAGSWAAAGLLALLLAALPFIVSPYLTHVATTMAIAVILSVGLNLLMGFAGLVSLANAAFYGIGAYGVAVLGTRYGVPFVAALPLVALATAAIGFVVGLPALRVSSHYLALATLAFVWTVQAVLINWSTVTGGAPGFATTRAGLGLALFDDERRYYFLALAVTLAMVAVARNLVDSRIGRAFMAVRDNENAAEIMGVRLAATKTLAFATNAFYCAVAGGLQAGLVRFLDPYEFGVWPSIWHLLYIVVGGLGSIAGSVVGPVILVSLPEALRAAAEYRELIFAVLLLVVLIYAPYGVVGFVGGLWHRRGVAGAEAVPLRRDVRLPPARARRASPAPNEALLRVEGVGLAFGGLRALQDARLSLRAGEIRALIGPNGAGKTTLLNVLCRVFRPDSGTIDFRGASLLDRRAHDLVEAGIVRTFQNVRLFGRMSVLGNVLVGMHAHLAQGLLGAALGLPAMRAEAAAAETRARALLAYVGLAGKEDLPAASLPFGQQRRLELARALAAEPILLLLDEPASGLDRDEIAELTATLRTIRDELGVAILLIEHDMNFVMGLADRITVLDHGVTIAEGTPAEVQRDPAVIEAYLGRGVAPTGPAAASGRGDALADA